MSTFPAKSPIVQAYLLLDNYIFSIKIISYFNPKNFGDEQIKQK